MKKIFSGILVILVSWSTSYSQTNFVKNHLSSEYKSEAQCLAILQNDKGLIYFTTTEYVIEFDGVSFNKIKLPAPANQLTLDSSGVIFVSCSNDIGYLKSNETGELNYCSIINKVPENDRDFNLIWRSYALNDKIVFQSESKILIYENDTVNVIYPEGDGFYLGYLVENNFYVQDYGIGLKVFKNDKLELIPDGELLATDFITEIFPYINNQMLLVSYYNGIYIYDFDLKITEKGSRLYKSDIFNSVDDFLINSVPNCGTTINKNKYVVGTIGEGLIIFDENGNILQSVNNGNGLFNNTIYNLICDKDENIWATTDNGISHISSNIQFVEYSKNDGIDGSVYSVKYFNDKLYVATQNNIFIQDDNNKFIPLENSLQRCFHLFEVGDLLLAATLQGVAIIKDKNAEIVDNTYGQVYLHFSEAITNNNLIYAGYQTGIVILKKEKNTIKFRNVVKNYDKTTYVVFEDKNGFVWTCFYPSLYKLKLNPELDSVISSELCTKDMGLPSDHAVPYKLNNGKIVFGTLNGIYEYNYELNKFQPDTQFKSLKYSIEPFTQLSNGDIFYDEINDIDNSHKKGILTYSDGEYQQINRPFLKFIDDFVVTSNSVDNNGDSVIYIGTTNNLLEFFPEKYRNYDLPFQTLIRKAFVKDSIIYGGAVLSENINYKIKFNDNKITFHYACMFFEDAEKNLYSYRLIGYDTAWSEWISDTKKEFINLYEGNYTFEVKSKNLYETEGQIASFRFTILAPWYRTWFAYFLYFILFSGLIFLIIKLYTRRLVKQKEKLEQIVKERTSEIMQQKEEIQAQSEEIWNQKAILEKQKKDIIDSINYAAKIQSAVLPSIETFTELLPEHFVLFNPRDIVSGDFYWLKKVKNFTVVAIADCTGHGVPGAFMSMLGMSFLNEIVSRTSIDNSGQILNNLRKRIKLTLKQYDPNVNQKDGMDIVLISIDNENLELQFSGAYNPLYILRKNPEDFENPQGLDNPKIETIETDTAKLFELKADRQPVAVHIKETDFSTQKFQLLKNDMLYAGSDGFVDQVGGDKQKKFMSKNFKKLLLDIYNQPVVEQKLILEKTITEWKGNHEQVDDILVVGIKI